jgi:hypothetical protein
MIPGLMKFTTQSTANLDGSRTPVTRARLLAAALIVLAALVLTWTKGARHDYEHHYLVTWELVMSGQDPWSQAGGSGNAYGPAFNVLAPLAALHPLLPKYLFVACWFGLVYWYLMLARSMSPARSGSERWLLAFFLANPLFWIEIPVYGHFDILVACLCVAALHAYRRNNSVIAGGLIAAGTLMKFYPGVLLPLFALQDRRIDGKLVVSFLLVTGLGLGAAYLLWGASIFDPILWAHERPSKHLSIFRFLRGSLSPTPNLDGFSGPCTLGAVLAVLWYGRRYRIPLSLATFALFLALFTFYRVGHVQYLVLLCGLFPYVALEHRTIFKQDNSLRLAALGYFGWISLYLLLYHFGGEFNHPPMNSFREFGGLVTFPLSLWLLLATLQAARDRDRRNVT